MSFKQGNHQEMR